MSAQPIGRKLRGWAKRLRRRTEEAIEEAEAVLGPVPEERPVPVRVRSEDGRSRR